MLRSIKRSSPLLTCLLLIFLELIASAMVLPRPPSSIYNQLVQDHRDFARNKIYYPHNHEKSFHDIVENVNSRIEKPQPGVTSNDDLRLFEIALQGPEEIDAVNIQGLVQAMLKNSQQRADDNTSPSNPSPEVVPHSILGVRNVGLAPNFRLNNFNENIDDGEEKMVLLSPQMNSKLRNLDDEKLYYLKKGGRPKVYVKVRGHSGDFRNHLQEMNSSKVTLSDGPSRFLRVTRPFERQTEWKIFEDKKKASGKPPKKYGGRNYSSGKGEEVIIALTNDDNANDIKGVQASAYGLDDLSTTENSMVTSSELPKQIPAPPSKTPARILMAQTTPVHRFSIRRTDILPGYGYSED